MINTVLKLLLILAILGVLIGGAKLGQKKKLLNAEMSRKVVHIGSGLTVLTLPWLFSTIGPVLFISITGIALMLMLRYVPFIRSRFGGVLRSVKRESLGDIYLPISFLIVFALSQGDPILFCIPMALLALPDAMAALVGIRYGSVRYKATDGNKSVEGSLAFFALAFLIVHVPVLLATQVGRAESLVMAVILALLATMIEAVSWRGLDNLFVPIISFILLRTFLDLQLEDLVWQLFVAVALITFVFLFRRRTTLTDSGLLGAALLGYVGWALGGFPWLIPPVILFLSYRLFVPKRLIFDLQPHNIYGVMSVFAAGFIWLLTSKLMGRNDFLVPYTLTFAQSMTIVGIAHVPLGELRCRKGFVLVALFSLGGCLLFVLARVLSAASARTWTPPGLHELLICLCGIVLAAGMYSAAAPWLRSTRSRSNLDYFCRVLITSFCSFVAFLVP